MNRKDPDKHREYRRNYMRDHRVKHRVEKRYHQKAPAAEPTVVVQTLSQHYFGDPMPGRSALDQKKQKNQI